MNKTSSNAWWHHFCQLNSWVAPCVAVQALSCPPESDAKALRDTWHNVRLNQGVGCWNNWARAMLHLIPGKESGAIERFYWNFVASVDFSGRLFDKSLDMAGFIFPAETRFDKSQFASSVWLNDVRFIGPCDFIAAEFCGETVFEGAAFQEKSTFDDAVFRCPVQMRNTSFGGAVSMLRLRSLSDIWLAGSNFFSTADFRSSTFGGAVGLHRCHFRHAVYFGDSRFNDTASFEQTTFEELADFTGVEFKSRVFFEDAKIMGHTCFQGTTFNDAPGLAAAIQLSMKPLETELTLIRTRLVS